MSTKITSDRFTEIVKDVDGTFRMRANRSSSFHGYPPNSLSPISEKMSAKEKERFRASVQAGLAKLFELQNTGTE